MNLLITPHNIGRVSQIKSGMHDDDSQQDHDLILIWYRQEKMSQTQDYTHDHYRKNDHDSI